MLWKRQWKWQSDRSDLGLWLTAWLGGGLAALALEVMQANAQVNPFDLELRCWSTRCLAHAFSSNNHETFCLVGHCNPVVEASSFRSLRCCRVVFVWSSSTFVLTLGRE